MTVIFKKKLFPAIFSKKFINAAEELCFDYGENQINDDPTNDQTTGRKPCFCESLNCRGLLPNLGI